MAVGSSALQIPRQKAGIARLSVAREPNDEFVHLVCLAQ